MRVTDRLQKKREDGFSRLFVTRVLRLVLFLTFGTWVKDANTPYRLMNAKQLSKVLKKDPGRIFSFQCSDDGNL